MRRRYHRYILNNTRKPRNLRRRQSSWMRHPKSLDFDTCFRQVFSPTLSLRARQSNFRIRRSDPPPSHRPSHHPISPTMSPEHTESTPLLIPGNTSSIPSEDDDTISSADLRERRSHTRLASSYRRPSFVAGGRGILLSSSPIPDYALRDDEAFDCVREERGLLKRNSLISVGGARRGSAVASADGVEDVEETWDDAIKTGGIKTSWRYELGVLVRFSGPLVVTFCMSVRVL